MARFLAIERETVFLKALIDEARRLLGRELTGTELKRIKLPQREWDSRLDTIKPIANAWKPSGSRFWKASKKNRRNTSFERIAREPTRSLSTESDAAISVAGFLNTR
jgi:hypothetical protein